MRTVYSVTVEVSTYDDEGTFVRSDVLFTASHHRPESLLRFAPGEVESALREQAYADEPQRVTQGITEDVTSAFEKLARGDVERAEPASGDVAGMPELAAATTKRKRRTKAEIEADKARELVERAQQLGTPSPAEAPPGAPAEAATDPLHTAEDQAAPPPPAGTAGGGEPWNPFKQS